jgi:hypothetical protein
MQGQRIIFEFQPSSEEPESSWNRVITLLRSVDGQALDLPSGESSSLIRAFIPKAVDASAFLRKLRELEGVGRVELDAPRMIF